ncbi:aldo/keto reductase, partial [Kitasatospora sp. NPDC059571]|uniref:aldo/keto reductase n=1 Tax=Kitasatospora sp. NPDC059571 TaxID=3346871 RepID=UPI00369A73B7
MRQNNVRTGPVRVTELAFGAAAIGNLFTPVSDEQAAEAVTAAWEAGVRYFDTAPHYGLGLSERRLGAVLHGLPREEYTVSTKVGPGGGPALPRGPLPAQRLGRPPPPPPAG